MAMFQLRADTYPPCFIVYSVPDDKFVTVICRDKEITRDSWHRSLPPLRESEYINWPLMDDHFPKDALGQTVPRSVPIGAAEAIALAERHKEQGTVSHVEWGTD
jgi:hypothetical protein